MAHSSPDSGSTQSVLATQRSTDSHPHYAAFGHGHHARTLRPAYTRILSESPVRAQIRSERGAPRLFIDDVETYPLVAGLQTREPSFASERYSDDGQALPSAFARHIEAAPTRSRILGYQIGSGIYGEWHCWLAKEETGPFGCFKYTYPFRETSAVRLHFQNVNLSGHGALSAERRDSRTGELKALFTDVRDKHERTETVRGGSWLYNIQPYRVLFPPEYIASAKPVGYELVFWSLWGQFLRGKGKPNATAIAGFREAIRKAKTTEECESAFPFQAMRPECSIEHFFEFYGI